jgi:hypothetical protein
MNDSQPLIPTTIWLALFPLTYLIHFAEEYWGGEGYPAYLLRLRGVDMSTTRFVTLKVIALVLLVTGVIIARQLKFPEFMIVLLAGAVLANGISHTATAIWDGHYGPGLLSSALLWLPLGAFSLIYMFGRITHTSFATATLIGFGIQGIVALIALRSGRGG